MTQCRRKSHCWIKFELKADSHCLISNSSNLDHCQRRAEFGSKSFLNKHRKLCLNNSQNKSVAFVVYYWKINTSEYAVIPCLWMLFFRVISEDGFSNMIIISSVKTTETMQEFKDQWGHSFKYKHKSQIMWFQACLLLWLSLLTMIFSTKIPENPRLGLPRKILSDSTEGNDAKRHYGYMHRYVDIW